jgi:hypothetical protein
MIDKIMDDEIVDFGNEVKAVFVLVISPEDEKAVRELSRELKARYDEDLWAYYVYKKSDTLEHLGITSTPSMIVRIDREEGSMTYPVKFDSLDEVLGYIDTIKSGDFSGLFQRDEKLVASSNALKRYLVEVLKVDED